VTGTKLAGTASCTGTWLSPNLPAGSYVVRAVDYAGNEDTNGVTLQLGDPCRAPVGCAVGGAKPAPPSGVAALVGAGAMLLIGLLRRRVRHARASRESDYRTR
jgi:MYXO-CTERM domain-containing protein